MPKITCKCGTTRVIMAGKSKHCKQCNARLSTLPPVEKAPAPEADAPEVLALREGIVSRDEQIAELNHRQTATIAEMPTSGLIAVVVDMVLELGKRPDLTPKGVKWTLKLAKAIAGCDGQLTRPIPPEPEAPVSDPEPEAPVSDPEPEAPVSDPEPEAAAPA